MGKLACGNRRLAVSFGPWPASGKLKESNGEDGLSFHAVASSHRVKSRRVGLLAGAPQEQLSEGSLFC